MEGLLKQVRSSLIACLVILTLTTALYPVLVWGVTQIIFTEKANGSLIRQGNAIVGSSLIGQKFTSPRYFHPRPSHAGEGYDGASSSGSNAGPLSAKYLETIKQRVEAYRTINGLSIDRLVPADAVTASGSGLDPHISVANAEIQMHRIARARGMNLEALRSFIKRYTDGPDFGILGEERVNVLLLNLALDQQAQ